MEISVMKSTLEKTINIYGGISQSYWRAFEVLIIKQLIETKKMKKPILEIGCGSGGFSSLVFDSIDVGIDINPRAIEKIKKSSHIYKELYCMDAGCMTISDKTFNLIFANCVMEHIPNIEAIIKDCYRVLCPNGVFLVTVPLIEMNNHLMFRSEQYSSLRRKQLQHVNLYSSEEWERIFRTAGFSKVEIYPYLFGEDCYLWDSMDFPVCIGAGRFTIGNFISHLSKLIPQSIKKTYIQYLAGRLASRSAITSKKSPCAAAILAYK